MKLPLRKLSYREIKQASFWAGAKLEKDPKPSPFPDPLLFILEGKIFGVTKPYCHQHPQPSFQPVFIKPESTNPRPSVPPFPTNLKEGNPSQNRSRVWVRLTIIVQVLSVHFPPPHSDGPCDSTRLGSEPVDLQQSQERIFFQYIQRV